jgi:hypothetical protein
MKASNAPLRNQRTLITAAMALGVLLPVAGAERFVPAEASRRPTRLEAAHGSKVTVIVKSDLVDWEMEGSSIEGAIEVGRGFPIEPGELAFPGGVPASATAWVPVRSLKSTKGGKPYSEALDSFAYERMKAVENPRVLCVLERFALREAAASQAVPHQFEATGHIALAGVTNAVSIRLNVLPLGHKKLRISGQKTLRLTDFGITLKLPGVVDPPTAKLHDEVEVSFEWVLSEHPQP